VGVSSVTGDGIKEFFEAVEASRDEYEKYVFLSLFSDRDYLPELKKARAQRKKSLQTVKDDSMNRLLKDLSIDRAQNPSSALNDRWDSEEENADEGDIDIMIIDRCKRGFFNDNYYFFRSLTSLCYY
jgi:GPN-loop GTPase